MHALLKTLCDDKIATPLGEGEISSFIAQDGLRVLFLAGDPNKKLETADVAIVLRELVKANPGALTAGLVTAEAEKEAMELASVFALPSLIFYARGEKLETLPKIQDWSVYAEALPRLLKQAESEAV